MNQNKIDKYQKQINSIAFIRHLMKCNRGQRCPWISCRTTSKENKKRCIEKFARLSFYKHYMKCREMKKSTMILDRKGLRPNNVCLCGFIRGCMQQLKKKYFPSSPMKLQVLAAYAVPKEAIHEASIHTECLIRSKNSARCIQRQWRSYLQARGPYYRTRVCKFNMRGSCRRGVHCTFAHGNHDVRFFFDHSNHDVRKKNTGPTPVDDCISNLDEFLLSMQGSCRR